MGCRNVPLSNSNKTGEPRLGRQQIIATWVEALVGNAVTDREEFTSGIEEKAEFHLLEYGFRELD